MGTILVTGAGGYLGAQVLSALRLAGHEAIGLTRRGGPGLNACDLLDTRSLNQFMEKVKPSKLVHCAWESPKAAADYKDEAAAERSITMLDNVLDATSAPMLLISSMTVYEPRNCTRAYREEDAVEPDNAYAWGKWAGEQHLYSRRRKGFSVRLPGLFGGGRQSGLVWNLAHALTLGDRPQLPVRPLLWGAMDVRDAAHAIVRLCDVELAEAYPVNIGYADTYSVSRLIALLDELTGRTTLNDVDHPDFAFDLSRASELGAAPHQTLRGACLRLIRGDA